jgi:hypothetical protein
VAEHVADAVDGSSQVGVRDDLGERAVEIEQDARGGRPLAEGVEVSP